MDETFDVSALQYRQDRSRIEAGRCEEDFAKRLIEAFIRFLQGQVVVLDDAAYEGVSIGMDTGGRKSENDIARSDCFACDEVFLVNDADSKASYIVIAFGIETCHFSGFAAESAQPDSMQALATPLTISAISSGSSFPVAM